MLRYKTYEALQILGIRRSPEPISLNSLVSHLVRAFFQSKSKLSKQHEYVARMLGAPLLKWIALSLLSAVFTFNAEVCLESLAFDLYCRDQTFL